MRRGAAWAGERVGCGLGLRGECGCSAGVLRVAGAATLRGLEKATWSPGPRGMGDVARREQCAPVRHP